MIGRSVFGIRSSVIGRRSVGGGDRTVGIPLSVGRRSVGGGDRTAGIRLSVGHQLGLDGRLSSVVGQSLVVDRYPVASRLMVIVGRWSVAVC